MLGMEDTHKKGHIAAILAAWLCFVVVIVVTFLSHGPLDTGGLFENKTLDVLQAYNTSLSPADWTYFIMWTLIFLWLFVTLCYSISTIFRFTSYGYLYIAPGHVTWAIYLILVIGMLFHTVWLFVVNMGYFAWTFFLSLMTTAVLFLAVAISLRRMFIRGLVLQREEVYIEIWICRMTLHNALDMYATWFFYLSLLNLNTEMVYSFRVAQHLSGTVTMGILLLIIVGFYCFDIFALDKYTRYCFGGYISFVVGLFGSVINNWNGNSSVTMLTTLTLVVACLALAMKLAVLVSRHRRDPIWTGSTMFLPSRTYGAMEACKSGSPNLTYSSDVNHY